MIKRLAVIFLVTLTLVSCSFYNHMVTFVDNFNGFRITISDFHLVSETESGDYTHPYVEFTIQFVNVSTSEKSIPSYAFELQENDSIYSTLDDSENVLPYLNETLGEGMKYTNTVAWYSSSEVNWSEDHGFQLHVLLDDLIMYRFRFIQRDDESTFELEPIL